MVKKQIKKTAILNELLQIYDYSIYIGPSIQRELFLKKKIQLKKILAVAL